ncbi:MAG: hypothetical protein DCC49_11215 [Acidobacteria bacterium]|nr:MAG: hypothetical protein DCC49_11215 [Acidobacteriota bacterium]
MQSAALVGALALAIAWASGVAIVIAARHVKEIEVGQATSDLGSEAPAVAALLASRFRLPSEAAPSTILDLAARRVIRIEDYQPGLPMVRLTGGSTGGLTPYEERVMELLESKASGGVVPAEALSAGEGEVSTRWRRAFRNDVIDEAQQLGLSKDIWDAQLTAIFGALALIPAGLVFLATKWQPALVVYAFAAFVLQTVRHYRPQQPTALGIQRASYWLGVREYFSTHGEFEDVGPSGVAVWGRNLAYAAAFEIAESAVRALPMGDEDDKNAWSPWGGKWHPVKVRYPVRYPPMWGKHPLVAAGLSVLMGGAGAMVLLVGSKVNAARATSSLPGMDGSGGSGTSVGDVAQLVVSVLFIVGLVVFLAGLTGFVRAIADMTTSRTVEGYLVRKRRRRGTFDSSHTPKYRCYLAVDDGSTPEIKAWRVSDEIFDQVEQGAHVTAEATRFLGYVKSIRPISVVTHS